MVDITTVSKTPVVGATRGDRLFDNRSQQRIYERDETVPQCHVSQPNNNIQHFYFLLFFYIIFKSATPHAHIICVSQYGWYESIIKEVATKYEYLFVSTK